MTAAPDFTAVPPPVGPSPVFNILPWILWVVLGLSVAVMAVIGGMLVTAPGRRYLRDKNRKDPNLPIRLLLGCVPGALIAGTAVLILQLVSS
ncbi:hypothetical protein [Rhodococcus qingshengii]|nr:hypothetical protein [Rhodococcus qingshengii]